MRPSLLDSGIRDRFTKGIVVRGKTIGDMVSSFNSRRAAWSKSSSSRTKPPGMATLPIEGRNGPLYEQYFEDSFLNREDDDIDRDLHKGPHATTSLARGSAIRTVAIARVELKKVSFHAVTESHSSEGIRDSSASSCPGSSTPPRCRFESDGSRMARVQHS